MHHTGCQCRTRTNNNLFWNLYSKDSQLTKEEQLILKYLSGFLTTGKKGRPSRGYLKPGDPEELEARAALARRLRSVDAFTPTDPLTFYIRDALASLFATNEIPGEGTIEIKDRHPSRSKKITLTLAVGDFLSGRRRAGKFDSHVKEAEQKFGLKRRAVFKYWAVYRSLFDDTDPTS
jgi:hypothetical protein